MKNDGDNSINCDYFTSLLPKHPNGVDENKLSSYQTAALRLVCLISLLRHDHYCVTFSVYFQGSSLFGRIKNFGMNIKHTGKSLKESKEQRQPVSHRYSRQQSRSIHQQDSVPVVIVCPGLDCQAVDSWPDLVKPCL